MKQISFDDSHIYIGSFGKLNFRPLMDCVYLEIPIYFIDGAISMGNVEVIDPVQIVLYVAPYTTAAGTAIKAKTWVLVCIENSDVWKVSEKYNV